MGFSKRINDLPIFLDFFSFCGVSFTDNFLEFITNPYIVIYGVGTSTDLSG